MPCSWSELGLGDAPGRVHFVRRFGLPRKLDPHERVWLILEGAERVAEVTLNEQRLPCECQAGGMVECEVTKLLDTRNHLHVSAEGTTGDSKPWDEVALEIRCTAYLRGVRVWSEQREASTYLHATAEVVGNAEQPLEVYLLHDNRTVAYSAVTAGLPFEVVSEPLRGQLGEVRVELVCGAVVWYTVEISSIQV